jgi:hypothetical protein
MNLNNNPTQEQLRELLHSCDDNAGRHIIRVDRRGEVHITLLPDDEMPASWAKKMHNQIQFRYKTHGMGSGYVGPEAAKDAAYVQLLFRDLLQDWQSGSRGYIEK